jgi:hypothetical protein
MEITPQTSFRNFASYHIPTNSTPSLGHPVHLANGRAPSPQTYLDFGKAFHKDSSPIFLDKMVKCGPSNTTQWGDSLWTESLGTTRNRKEFFQCDRKTVECGEVGL